MPRFMFDTNCMIAAVTRSHRHHLPSADEYNRRLDRGETLMVAAHSLAEAYSVLTRAPAPLRLSADHAASVLERSFVSQCEVIALDEADYVALLRSSPVKGVTGGLVYDAIIAACAGKARVDVFVTYDERHFRRVVDQSLQIIAPRADDSP